MNYFPFFTHSPIYAQQTSYCNYSFFQKINQINELLKKKDQEIQFLKDENNNLKSTILQLQNKLDNQDKKTKPIRKITKNYYRRNACAGPDSNSRLYCPYNDCNHHYSSILALNFHIKYKHNGGNKKQREAYAKIIIQSQLKGEQAPKINFNFPPGFLQKYRNNYLKSNKATELEQNKKKIEKEQQIQNLGTQ